MSKNTISIGTLMRVEIRIRNESDPVRKQALIEYLESLKDLLKLENTEVPY